MPNVKPARGEGAVHRRPSASLREYASEGSNAAATSATRAASSQVNAKTDGQSSDRHAGTTPLVDNSPRLGFSPTRLLNAAGTRPDPAVSVPSAKLTKPRATAAPDPELEPPV